MLELGENPLFSVVIPHWNALHYLPACMEALCAQTYPSIEIIVADNASTDGSQEYLREHYPQVRIVQLPENRGFTGACNAGIEGSQGEIISLLNNDTEVDSEWAAEVAAAFDRHPEAGSVASKMILADKRDTLHTAGDYYRTDGLAGNRGVWQLDGPEYNEERMVFSACGGSSAYRRTMLDEVGLLDNDFFFSCEDVDIGWRAQLSGWTCVYAPKAIVYHHLKATGGGATASYYDGRNTLWVIAKNYPGPLLRKNFGGILKAQWGRAWEAVRAWRGEAARATLRGMIAGIVSLPRALRKRKQIQSGRKVSLEYIESIMAEPDEVR